MVQLTAHRARRPRPDGNHNPNPCRSVCCATAAGFPETAAGWRDYVTHFGADGFHALACDLRNVNQSLATSSHYSFSLDGVADDLLGIVDSAVGPEGKAIVVGHE